MITLAALEEIIDASGIAPRIEAVLPIGVRSRQLRVRTLLAGMCLTQADGRPAHLTRVHQALTSLPGEEQRRLGVITEWKHGPHLLTYRQAEYTFGLIAGALGKQEPDGLPSAELQAACDDLLEASIPDEHKTASAALAVDWTDMETFSRPPPKGTSDCADPEASWGHRKNNLLRCEDELFYGYYLSAGIMMPDEHGPPVPEYARRITLSSCRQDPVPAFVPVLTALPAAGIALGDILADSGYAYRIPANWAVPLRAAGAQLVQDLHPSDRGPHGTHHGAIISNGNLYCPQAPRALLQLGPLARDATREQAAAHDTPDRGAGPLQARPHHQRRPRRLPPRHVPRRHGQDPLPAPPAVHDPGPGPTRDPHPAAGPARLLHPADPHRPPGQPWPRPRRNTTTPPPRTAAPTPAAPAPNAASPPSKTPPATTSPAAGAASWAWPPGCCSPPAWSSPATSASPPPGTPARKTTPAAPPPACRPEPAADAANHLASLVTAPP